MNNSWYSTIYGMILTLLWTNDLFQNDRDEASMIYRKTSSISRTKFQNLNVSCILLQLSSLNSLKPGVKLIMKMLEQRRQAMLQLHLSYQQLYCLLRCDLYYRFYGRKGTFQYVKECLTQLSAKFRNHKIGSMNLIVLYSNSFTSMLLSNISPRSYRYTYIIYTI